MIFTIYFMALHFCIKYFFNKTTKPQTNLYTPKLKINFIHCELISAKDLMYFIAAIFSRE